MTYTNQQAGKADPVGPPSVVPATRSVSSGGPPVRQPCPKNVSIEAIRAIDDPDHPAWDVVAGRLESQMVALGGLERPVESEIGD